MAGVIPQDRRGQIMLLLTVAALVTGFVLWKGLGLVGVQGWTQYHARRDSLQTVIDTLEAQIRSAKADIQHGTVGLMQQRLGEFQARLALMRELVPGSAEVPNLLDDIASRAKIRGAAVVAIQPQAVESGAPFDTQRATFTVTGKYDQIGEFLTDVASLPRIVVPYDIRLQHITGPGSAADTASPGLLRLSFQIRTFVKSAAEPGRAAPADTAPAPAAARPGATRE